MEWQKFVCILYTSGTKQRWREENTSRGIVVCLTEIDEILLIKYLFQIVLVLMCTSGCDCKGV